MDALINSVSGLGNFALYFAVSILLLFVFKVVYAFVTPHNEWELVKVHKNQAAAIGFGGAMIGFSIALAGAVANSEFLIDLVVWGVVAIVAQSFAFALLRVTFMPKIADRIDNNDVSAGTILATVSISVGLLNAACMSY